MAGKKWIDLPTAELLQEFGKGKCVPGSGSAAALQGLLSARLLQTVIKITLKKEEYAEWHSQFIEIQTKIENTSLPDLERLLQDDSDHFDSVIKLKNDVKNAADPETKSQIENDLLKAQQIATELLIKLQSSAKNWPSSQ
jgi:formiminotetrahydrofolate cyclodeaminase